MGVLAFLLAATPLALKLINAGMNAAPLIERMIEVGKLEKDDPVPAEHWDALHRVEDDLRARLNDTRKDSGR